jgi:tetratricopeptide (TPR) repeat protein
MKKPGAARCRAARPGGNGRGAAVPRLLRESALLGLLLAAAVPGPCILQAQDAVPPLPPPVTRSLYRSHWFDFLSAYSEKDAAAASRALDEMVRAGRKVGVQRLSDFSRTAVYLGMRAERHGQPGQAERAYQAALRLDPADPDAVRAQVSFLVRHGRLLEALGSLPSSIAAFLSARETRIAVLSSLGAWTALAVAVTLVGAILALGLRYFPRLVHDLRETARRAFGGGAATPLALLAVALPVFFGFGPAWLVLYWGALLWAYLARPERLVLSAVLIALSLCPVLLAWISRENVQQRAPLVVAATDLAERREDASAEDGLRQAAAVFPEDSDVWFLLGTFAERSGDLSRAQAEYGRAVRADPNDYRPILNRGNVHFTEGDFGEAIRDYIEASHRAPTAAEAFYNLSLARGEIYDFDGQAQAIARARLIAPSQVTFWMSNPTFSRVVPADYPLSRARARVEEWNTQPKSRRLPGHGTAVHPWHTFFSAWSLAPIAALLAGPLLARLRKRELASECGRCGRVMCDRCRRYGDPALYCAMCARFFLKREDVDIELQAAEARAMQRRALWRSRSSRLASLVLPGSGAFLVDRPAAGALTLFLFGFGLAAIIVDARLFDALNLAPVEPGATTIFGGLLVLVVWVRAQFHARRISHGS